MTSIFDEVGQNGLTRYLELVASCHEFDLTELRELSERTMQYYSGNGGARLGLRRLRELEARWYASLDANMPDYEVYRDDLFIAELWACWLVYSRKYLRMLRKIVDRLPSIESVYDLGCGCGYTTAALKELFPNAEVRGTQIEGTFQFSVARALGEHRGFHVDPDVGKQADLIFASEYFEHWQDPIRHLRDVVLECKPKALVIANSFGAISIGHFRYYDVSTETDDAYVPRFVQNTNIGREFNGELRRLGYAQMPTGFWNNRPAVWTKVQNDRNLQA